MLKKSFLKNARALENEVRQVVRKHIYRQMKVSNNCSNYIYDVGKRMNDFIKIAQEVLELEAKELSNAAKLIGTEIVEATNLIANIKGKLIVTGVGKSGLDRC